MTRRVLAISCIPGVVILGGPAGVAAIFGVSPWPWLLGSLLFLVGMAVLFGLLVLFAGVASDLADDPTGDDEPFRWDARRNGGQS